LRQFFDDRSEISKPQKGELFYGQDAHYQGFEFSYKDNGDGTISDLNTGLMWQKTPDFGRKMKWDEAHTYADSLRLAGFLDWRLPTIKELLSIASFDGNVRTLTPYLDTNYFDFEYPDTNNGWRIIDAQYATSTKYIRTIMRGDEGFFGFNFADGHLKCYPIERSPRGVPTYYVRCVRGGNSYGENQFVDNSDGTITDLATGMMWQKADDSKRRNWKDALAYAENLEFAGYDDWHVPDVKELHSIVDYSRAAPSIDPIFNTTNKEGWYWTSTSFLDRTDIAICICFGRAVDFRGMDTHGSGALRGDLKSGNASDFPTGLGPQRDEVRIMNYVRCVRTMK